MQLKTISSAQTFWIKVLLPAFWISSFGLGTLGLWLGVMHGKDNTPPPDGMKFIFTIVWIAGTALFLWGYSLKRVRVDDNYLHVSNYLREITTPITNIKDVKQRSWISTNNYPITVYFQSTTDFGDKIVFMPKIRFWGFGHSAPIVAELKDMSRKRPTDDLGHKSGPNPAF